MLEPLTTEELAFRVYGLTRCAAQMIRHSDGEPFPPPGLNTLMETLFDVAGELADRCAELENRPAPAPGKYQNPTIRE